MHIERVNKSEGESAEKDRADEILWMANPCWYWHSDLFRMCHALGKEIDPEAVFREMLIEADIGIPGPDDDEILRKSYEQASKALKQKVDQEFKEIDSTNRRLEIAITNQKLWDDLKEHWVSGDYVDLINRNVAKHSKDDEVKFVLSAVLIKSFATINELVYERNWTEEQWVELIPKYLVYKLRLDLSKSIMPYYNTLMKNSTLITSNVRALVEMK